VKPSQVSLSDVISKRTTFSQPFPPPSDPPANAPWFLKKILTLYKPFTYLVTCPSACPSRVRVVPKQLNIRSANNRPRQPMDSSVLRSKTMKFQFTRQLQERLNAFLKRARTFGFCDEIYTTAELLDTADARLLRLVQGPEHCLHRLLPDTINSCYMELRHRGHSFPLLRYKYNLYRNWFFHGVCSNV